MKHYDIEYNKAEKIFKKKISNYKTIIFEVTTQN